MIYVTYDAYGALTGGYSQDLQEEHIDHYIEVEQSVQLDWPKYRANAARDGVELLPPVEPPAPTPAPRYITKFAFRRRFTMDEKVLIDLASIDDPTAAAPLRQRQATIRVLLKEVDTAEFIDLDLDATRGGALQLESYGLLAAGRALEILDSPVISDEIFD